MRGDRLVSGPRAVGPVPAGAFLSGRPEAAPRGLKRPQRPYVWPQIRASGLSGRQPPYCLPRAQTPGFPGTAWVPEGASVCGVRGGRRWWGPECHWWWPGKRGAGARCCRPGGAGAAGACEVPTVGSEVPTVGSGDADASTRSRASRAGAWTGRRAAAPLRSGRGVGGGESAVAGRDTGGRSTVTQPVRAETATVTRSVAVVVVRCTRATLLGPGRRGTADGSRMPRTGDLRPRRGCGRCVWLTPTARHGLVAGFLGQRARGPVPLSQGPAPLFRPPGRSSAAAADFGWPAPVTSRPGRGSLLGSRPRWPARAVPGRGASSPCIPGWVAGLPLCPTAVASPLAPGPGGLRPSGRRPSPGPRSQARVAPEAR